MSLYYLLRKSKRRIMDDLTRYMDASVARATRPYARAGAEPPLPRDPVNYTLLPVLADVRLRAAQNETQNALLMTALALHAYRLERGRYPDRLERLVPRYLDRVPNDPFSGQPLRYRPASVPDAAAAYCLYCVGPDGKDDGGRAIDDPRRVQDDKGRINPQRRYWAFADSRGDIVGGVNFN